VYVDCGLGELGSRVTHQRFGLLVTARVQGFTLRVRDKAISAVWGNVLGPMLAAGTGHKRGKTLRVGWVLWATICVWTAPPAGSQATPERTPCQYFGRSSTTSGDRVVKSTCPPPIHHNAYYFIVDLDPGSTSGVLTGSAVVSPADAVCDQTTGNCDADVGPGYDLYAASGCLPVPAAQGLENAAIEGRSTWKSLVLKAGSFERFYVAAVRRKGIADGSKECSLTLLPGYLGRGERAVCSILDFTPNATVLSSTITTTVTVKTFNSTSNASTTTVKTSEKVFSSTTAKIGESTGTEETTNTTGAITMTTTTTIHTRTIGTETPERIDFCKPPAQPIPGEHIFATVVVAIIGAGICFWLILRREARRTARQVCVETEENFRNALQNHTKSQEQAIVGNAFMVSEVIQAREERNDSIRSINTLRSQHRSGLVDNHVDHDVEKAGPVPGQSSFNPYGQNPYG
jgi:hypothetical protein